MSPKLLISSDLENIRQAIKIHLGGVLGRTPREKLLNHPDILYFPADSKLGIEQARQIKKHFSTKPYLKSKAVVLEDASALTMEAQNALLKTLEEPPEGAILILGVKSESDLLPTVLSRCQIVILGTTQSEAWRRTPESKKDSGQSQNDIEKLLESSIEERFEYIEKLKDREDFLQALTHFFRNKLLRSSYTQHAAIATKAVKREETKFLKELLQAEEWAAQNVSIRAILEYLMLVMPAKI